MKAPNESTLLVIVYGAQEYSCALPSRRSNLQRTFQDACLHFGISTMEMDRLGLWYGDHFVDPLAPLCSSRIPSNAVMELKPRRDEAMQHTGESDSSAKNRTELAEEFQVDLEIGNSSKEVMKVMPSVSILQILRMLGFTEERIVSEIESVFLAGRTVTGMDSFANTTLLTFGIRDGATSFRIIRRGIRSSGSIVADGKGIEYDFDRESRRRKIGASGVQSDGKDHEEIETSQKKTFDKLFLALLGECADEHIEGTISTLKAILYNLISEPNEERFRRLRTSNRRFSETFGRIPAALDLLRAAGFALEDASSDSCPVYVLEKSREDSGLLYSMLVSLEKFQKLTLVGKPSCIGIGISQPASLPIAATESHQSFDPFRSDVVRFANFPQNNLQSCAESELESLKAKRDSIIASSGIPERNIRMWLQGSTNPDLAQISDEIISDASSSVTEPSVDSSILSVAAKTRLEKEKESEKFKTRVIRELETIKKSKVYKQTVIRVRFPDMFALEACFSPNECISDVVACIEGVLVPELKSSFFLHSPHVPKRLETDINLANAGLVPTAVIFLSWMSSINETPGFQTYLRAEEQRKMSSPLYRKPHAIPAGIDIVDSSDARIRQDANSASAPRQRKKLPKWLKL